MALKSDRRRATVHPPRPMARSKPRATLTATATATAKKEYAREVVAATAWLQQNISFPPWLKKVSWLALLAVVVFGAVLWLWNPASLPIETVRFEGVQYADAEKLRVSVADFTGAGFFGVNLHAVRQATRELPWVSDAAVYREWPGTLVIKVSEHVPVAHWQPAPSTGSGTGPSTGSGTGPEIAYLLSNTGTVFEPPPGTLPAGLPLLQGPLNSEANVLDYYRTLSSALGEAGLELAGLQYRASGSWQAKLADGLTLRLGRGEAPIGDFVTVYRKVLQPRLKEIEYVDLRYTNGIAVRWRKPAEKG